MREAATERVVVASAIGEQAGCAVEALAGEVAGGGHAVLAVARTAIGGEELDSGGAAQFVGEQRGWGVEIGQLIDLIRVAGAAAMRETLLKLLWICVDNRLL